MIEGTITKKKIGYDFSVIPNAVIRSPHITNMAKVLFIYINGMADTYQFSADRIAKDFDASTRAIRNGLKELENHGLLQRERTPKSNRIEYALCYDKSMVFLPENKVKDSKRVEDSDRCLSPKQVEESDRRRVEESSTVKKNNFKEEKETPPTPPPGGDGFLSPDQLPAPVNKSNTRKQTQEQPNPSPTPSRKKKRKYDPHCEAPIGHAKQVYHFTCIEDRIEAVIDAYRTLKPDDQTRSRGKENIRKLLETGNHSTHSLLLAVERYAAISQPIWSAASYGHIDYINAKARVETQFIKGVGNFFGKEALYKPFVKPGYRADIEEVDWTFFRQDSAHVRNTYNAEKYEWDYLWSHNMTTLGVRFVQRYGYTPAQLAGPYDRRFK